MRYFYACYWCSKRQVRHNPATRIDGNQALYLCAECAAEYDRQEAGG